MDGYDCVLEDLSDVYDSNPYGETVKISDKIQDGFKEYFTSKDQKQYVMNWAGGPNGLVYRNDYFIKNNWSVPNTTDELVSLTNTIRDNGYVPYIWNKSGYWDYVDYTWWAQYQGFDGYKDFFNAKNDSGKYTYEKFKQQGRLESMKVLSSLIANEKNSYPGSIASDHSSAQMKLYDQEDNYKVVMSPNGDWLENEMKKDYPAGTVDIRMMKTPVISSIVKVLPDKSITTDAQLSQAIAFIDGVDGAQKPTGLTDNDLSRIREARSLTYTLGYDHTAMIPVYANAKSLAKDYLRLMFSDIGLKIHHDTTGSTLPYKSDVYTSADTVSKMSSFQKSKNDILENSIYISRMYHNDPLFFKGGLRAYNKTVNGEYVVGALGAGKKSAETYILDEYNYIKSNFQTFKTNAGIKE